jgi:hypothetical protein
MFEGDLTGALAAWMKDLNMRAQAFCDANRLRIHGTITVSVDIQAEVVDRITGLPNDVRIETHPKP